MRSPQDRTTRKIAQTIRGTGKDYFSLESVVLLFAGRVCFFVFYYKGGTPSTSPFSLSDNQKGAGVLRYFAHLAGPG